MSVVQNKLEGSLFSRRMTFTAIGKVSRAGHLKVFSSFISRVRSSIPFPKSTGTSSLRLEFTPFRALITDHSFSDMLLVLGLSEAPAVKVHILHAEIKRDSKRTRERETFPFG